MESKSLQLALKFLGKAVKVKVDRPLGSRHPKHGFIYETNYGFIEGIKSADGEELDAYYLGIKTPVHKVDGVCIAIVHRLNDDDDKLVVVPSGMEMSDEQIMKAVGFQEKYFKSQILR